MFFISNALQSKMIDWSCVIIVAHLCKSLFPEGWALWGKLEKPKTYVFLWLPDYPC